MQGGNQMQKYTGKDINTNVNEVSKKLGEAINDRIPERVYNNTKNIKDKSI